MEKELESLSENLKKAELDDMIEEQLLKIRDSRFYKGEIYRIGQSISARKTSKTVDPEPSPSSLVGDILNRIGFQHLYEHQANLLNQIRRRKHSVICTPTGSGKSFISLLIAMETVLTRYRNVLFVFPNPNIGNRWVKEFEGITKDADWFYGIEFGNLLSQKDVDTFQLEKGMPQILFTTPEIINEELIPKKEKWDSFLYDLDLMVIDDAGFYTGIFGIHSSFLFRRLQRRLSSINCNPTYLVSMLPFKGYDAFVKILLNISFEPQNAITEDAREWSEKQIIFWNPPLDISKEDPKKIIRTQVSDELYAFLKMLKEIHSLDEDILVLTKDLGISEWDLKNLSSGVGGSELRIGEQIFCGKEIAEIDSEEFSLQNIKTVVIMGYAGSLPILAWEILHLGFEPLAVFIFNPQDPLSNFYIRNSEKFLSEGVSKVENIHLGISNRKIMETHILASIFEEAINEEDVIKYFGPDALRMVLEIVKIEKPPFSYRIRKVNEGKIVREFFVGKTPEVKQHEFSLFTADPLYCPIVEEDGTEIGFISKQIAPQKGTKGAVIQKNKERYRVREILYDKNSPQINRIVVEREKEIIRTERTSLVKIRSLNNFTKRPLEQFHLNLYFGHVEISESISGYRQFSCFECEFEKHKKVGLDKNIEVHFETDACFIHFNLSNGKSYPIHHSIKHLLKILLPTVLKYQKDEIEFRLIEWPDFGGISIAVYDNEVDGIGYSRFLFENLFQMEAVLEHSYKLLIDCPCHEGCSACLKIIACRDSEYNEKLEKRDTIEFLGRILQKKDLSIQMHRKYEPLGDLPGDFEILKDIAQIVLRVLEDKLGLKINNPVSTTFMDKKMSEQYKDLAGFWDLKQNVIAMQPLYHEIWYLDILSHEYFHDWQSKSGKFNYGVLSYYSKNYIDDPLNILFRGKLFVEGSANWAEFRTIDYFNFSSEMSRLNHGHFDQYGEGFHLIKYLEDQYGMREVFSFLETAILQNNNFHDIRARLYRNSGVEANIHQKEKEEKNREGLICLKYLNRRFEIVSISHYFDVTKDKPIAFPPKGAKLKREELLEILKRASVADVINANTAAQEVFSKNGMGCPSCASNVSETVESTAYMHSRMPKDSDPGVNAVELCNKLVNELAQLFQHLMK